MKGRAVVIEKPGTLALHTLALQAPVAGDVVVDIDYSGISTGTERLLYDGRMPSFPGMGYPLVPGYESVGTITASETDDRRVGEQVFVPGAQCYQDARGLFGGASARVVVPAERVYPVPEALAADGVLLALAATAHHALHPTGVAGPAVLPELIVGHGVVGRLLARLVVALGDTPVHVWEQAAARQSGATGYTVGAPEDDSRSEYRCIVDASGDGDVLDTLVTRLGRGGEIVLAGFYPGTLSFAFAPAFMREARLRIAAEWQGEDMHAIVALVAAGRLSLDGLISHRHAADDAANAYRRAFEDPASIKTILDWRAVQ